MPPRRSARSSTAQSTKTSDDQAKPRGGKRAAPSASSSSSSSKPRKAAKKEESTNDDYTKVDEVTEEEEKKPKGAAVKGKKVQSRTAGQSDDNVKAGEVPPESYFDALGDAAKETKRRHGVLESGAIHFVYRPKVMIDEAHSMDDVARLHLLLVPKTDSSSKETKLKRPFRLVLVGRKHLPVAKASGRPDIMWGEVIEAGDDFAALKDRMGPYSYDTKTQGPRHVSAAKVVGSGKYVINCSPDNEAPKNSKNASAVYKTYLAYTLETPAELGEVQRDFNIQHAAAIQLQVRARDAKSNNPALVRDMPENRKPQWPKALVDLFTTRFAPANPASLLNYPGTELLLIPSKHTVSEDIDKEAIKKTLDEKVVKEAEEGDDDDAGHHEGHDPKAAEHAVAVLKDLGLEAKEEDARELEGFWQDT